jgi:sialic acid synthase SpsE
MSNKPELNICGRLVGDDHPPLVIAEIGINHEGNLNTAFELVDAAISAGAEVIKHQTHVVEDEMSEAAKKVIPGNSSESIYDIMKRCALSEADEKRLKDYVDSQGAIFLSTPFSRAAADRLERIGVCAYKIGSGECNNYPLIEHVAAFKKPMIISTGMNNLDSIMKAVKIIRKYNIPYALLHTTNIYPTPARLVRLGAMQQMKKTFPDAIIGLSDHTTSNLACFSAVALGANILERHFTDRMDREGPDIVCSMDPIHLSELIMGSKEIAMMRGGKKEASEEEQPTIDFAFATVVSIKPIQKGELFTKDNIWIKRPGTGEILADKYYDILNKKSLRDIPNDTHLSMSDIKSKD